jgi:hypothetical protein
MPSNGGNMNYTELVTAATKAVTDGPTLVTIMAMLTVLIVIRTFKHGFVFRPLHGPRDNEEN